jgi:hypothetical protein
LNRRVEMAPVPRTANVKAGPDAAVKPAEKAIGQ